MELTYEQLDRIGRLADKADNYLSTSLLTILSPTTHVDGLTVGMREIRDEAQALYRELGGEE